jgi:hypothetical protein
MSHNRGSDLDCTADLKFQIRSVVPRRAVSGGP